VARLPGQVATRREDLAYLLMAEVYGARLRALELAHVPHAGAGDRHHVHSAGCAVVRRDRRGAVEGLAIGGGAGWALEDDVAAWPSTETKSNQCLSA
jgi:hypothetical protein